MTVATIYIRVLQTDFFKILLADSEEYILENVFKYARIKPHSKEAKLLSDAVAKYFNVDI